MKDPLAIKPIKEKDIDWKEIGKALVTLAFVSIVIPPILKLTKST